MPRLPHLRTLSSTTLVGAGTVAALVVATLAVAADPPKGTIDACASKGTGAMRLIDPSKKGTAGKCRSSERSIAWNAAGPTGPTGVQGASGRPGSDGSAGAAGAAGPAGPAGAVVTPSPDLRGATGPTGPTGPTGVPGATGPPGFRGPTGAAGRDGAAGIGANVAPSGFTQYGLVSSRMNLPSGAQLEGDINFPLTIEGGVTAISSAGASARRRSAQAARALRPPRPVTSVCTGQATISSPRLPPTS